MRGIDWVADAQTMGPISEFSTKRMMVNQTFSTNISFLECSAEYDILFLQVRVRTDDIWSASQLLGSFTDRPYR